LEKAREGSGPALAGAAAPAAASSRPLSRSAAGCVTTAASWYMYVYFLIFLKKKIERRPGASLLRPLGIRRNTFLTFFYKKYKIERRPGASPLRPHGFKQIFFELFL
jgi:hypothetical protein